MMGPGFGNHVGRSMLAGMIVAVAVSAVIAIVIWEIGNWVFRHLSVGWN